MTRWIGLLLALATLLGPNGARGQEAEDVARALAWEACLSPGPAASRAGLCAAANALDGWSPAETGTLLAYQGAAVVEGGDVGTGLELLSHALSLSPDEPTALLVRGIVRVERGDLEGGVRDLTAMLRLVPGHPEAVNTRAVAHVRMRQLPLAVAEFEI